MTPGDEERATTRQPEGSERHLRAFLENSGDLLMVTDAEGLITVLAGPVDELIGVPAATLIGTSVFRLVQAADLDRAQRLWALRTTSTALMPAEDFWTQRADGRWVCVSLSGKNLLADPAVGGIVMTVRDVTDRKNLDSARGVLGGANAALLLAGTETSLFSEICRVTVADETYHLAWIGLAEAARPLGVRMVACSDHSAGFFEALEHLAGDETTGGPIATALRTNEVRVVQDIATLPGSDLWRQLALDHGFRSLIALPLRFSGDDQGVLAIYASRPDVFSEASIAVLTSLTGDVNYGVDALRARAEQTKLRVRFEASLEATVRAVATAAELRDPYTAGHQRRVADLAIAIAGVLGIDPGLSAGIGVAASIHDIGKLVVPYGILSKPGGLSPVEFGLVQQHAQAGHDIVAGIDFPWPAAEMISQHHERLDGSGYPRGLRDEEVSIGARVIAVADVLEAMSSHRPYRPALGIDTAIGEILAGRGARYDSDVVDACVQLAHRPPTDDTWWCTTSG